MTASVAGIDIYYEQHFGKGIPVLLLHGWGGSHVSFQGVYDRLCRDGYAAINLDFPGFGSSGMPGTGFGIYDYAHLTAKFVEQLGLEQVIAVGHSFGGRVSILLGKLPFVKGLVLVDSAGMKPRRSAKYYIKVGWYKTAKKLGFKPVGGSADYKALAPEMRPVFNRVVNTHLECELPAIRCPTLIVWGDKDRDTPPYMAKRLGKGIRDSAVIMLPGGHYSYIDSGEAFYRILTAFVGEVSGE